jgi:hypothetical protein
MPEQPKTVSIKQLQTAVKAALEEAKRKHPSVRIQAYEATISAPLPLYYRYPYIFGLPPDPWWLGNLAIANDFAQSFASSLATNPNIKAAGLNGEINPVVISTATGAAIGFAPSDSSLTE